MKNTNKKWLSTVGAGLLGAVALSNVAQAQSPFAAKDLGTGYMVADAHAGKAKEGKCGEGKCGKGDMKGDAKMKDGKCGEGKCGAKDASMDAKGAGKDAKMKDGKCGEGKCGKK